MAKDGSLGDYDQRNVIARKEICLRDRMFAMSSYETKYLYSSSIVA